jgi:hypothetical protein
MKNILKKFFEILIATILILIIAFIVSIVIEVIKAIVPVEGFIFITLIVAGCAGYILTRKE